MNNLLNKEIVKVLVKILMDKEIQKRYDKKNNKLRWDLVPWDAFEKVVEIITEGAKEENYGVDNWKLVSSNVFDAAMIRHYVSYKKGETYDSRWNLTHLAHLVCNAIFLLWKETISINIEKQNNFIEHTKEKFRKNSMLGKFNKEKGELKSNGALKELEKGGRH